MLDNAARWIAEESKALSIPIVALTPAQAQGSGRGVCQHADLGAGGGGHHDCGPGFPMDYVLQLARSGGGPSLAAPRGPDYELTEGDHMTLTFSPGLKEGEAPYATVVVPKLSR